MDYFTPERKKRWTIFLLAIAWILLSVMLFNVLSQDSKFRLILLGLYVGVLFAANLLIIIFRVKIGQIGWTIFKHVPDLLVFILAGFLLFNWFLIYIAAYQLPHLIGSFGFVAILIFALAIFINLPSDVFKFVLPRYVLINFSVFLAIVVIEIFLGNYGNYQVWQANMNAVFIPADGVMPGIEGESHFTTDGYGIRGDPYDEVDQDAYRILAIGGSTTETLFLDNTEAWPYLIQQLAQEDDRSLWVGNVGRSGHATIDHYVVLKEFVPRFDLDMVVMMVGVNDMLELLWYSDNDANQGRIPDNLSMLDVNDLAEFEHSNFRAAQWRSGLLISLDFFAYNFQSLLEQQVYNNLEVEDQAGEIYDVRREIRQSVSPIVDTLPDTFDEGLLGYRENLIALVTEAQEQGIQIVFVTQPSVWSDTMPEDFDWYLWFGIIFDRQYSPIGRYSVEALADGMGQYNRVMLDVCEEYEVLCIDVADKLNGNPDYYYDDIHFNEAGSRLVAEVMWDNLAGVIVDK